MKNPRRQHFFSRRNKESCVLFFARFLPKVTSSQYGCALLPPTLIVYCQTVQSRAIIAQQTLEPAISTIIYARSSLPFYCYIITVTGVAQITPLVPCVSPLRTSVRLNVRCVRNIVQWRTPVTFRNWFAIASYLHVITCYKSSVPLSSFTCIYFFQSFETNDLLDQFDGFLYRRYICLLMDVHVQANYVGRRAERNQFRYSISIRSTSRIVYNEKY